MKTIKYTLLCLVAFLLWNGMVKGQSDSTKYKKFQVSVSYHRDYIMRGNYVWEIGRAGFDFKYQTIPFIDQLSNYSLGVHFKYYPLKYFYIKSCLQYNRQIYNSGRRYVDINNITKTSLGTEVNLKFIDIQTGFGFSFFNKGIVRPYIELNMDNSFLFHEKADCRLRNPPSVYLYDTNLINNTFKYYNLKGAISAGCEFHIKKRFVIGLDVNIRTIPVYQTKHLIIESLKYSNFGFGLSFGYAIK